MKVKYVPIFSEILLRDILLRQLKIIYGQNTTFSALSLA